MKRSTTIGLVALTIVFMVMVLPAYAQRGGDRGGRGGDRDRGGFGGGDFRARILERIDANGNGVIEPDEARGRAQGFIERMARDAGLEPGRPLPISRLTGDRSGGDDRSRGASSRGRNESNEDEYPTIAGFGDETVQKFGISPLTLAGKIVDLEKKYDRRVLDYVKRTMDRYDKNKNGILDHSEWSSIPWQNDPRDSDLDKDGILTRAEYAERIAKRFSGGGDRDRGRDRERSRGDDRRRGDDNRARGRGDSDDRSRGRFGRDGGDSRGGRGRGFGFDPTMFIARMDQNGDGQIGPDEVDERRRDFFRERFQIDLSKPIKIETIRKKFQERNGGGDREARRRSDDDNDQEDNAKAAYSIRGSEQLKGRKSYRSDAPALPKKLPAWWDDRDDNQDGQITLTEFAKQADIRKTREFAELDLNGDGLITAKEAALSED